MKKANMILEEFKINGDVAIISGCDPSWLKALSIALAHAGANIVIAGPGKEEIESAAEEVRHLGNKALSIPLGLASGQELEAMAEQVMAQFGRIDILVNSQNLQFGKPFLEMTEEEWGRVLEADLTSFFRNSKAVGKHMVKQKTGKIINIVSGAGERGLPNGVAYCASMGGVIQLTRALALEWARENVRVNAVGMGWMEMGIEVGQKDPILNYIPMRRRGKPEDIAPLVLFLASEASSYMTGYVYFVDGGVMARG
jgi:NAD(P)-dependent dehydrogenase (short-subunit alcohol dehydrogenase family)